MQPGQVAYGHSFDCRCILKTPKQPVEWTWRPFEQQGLKAAWDAKHFCQLLGHRVLYLVGDSTVRQNWNVVVNTVSQTGGACYKQIVYKKAYDEAPAEVIRKTDEPKTTPGDVSLDKVLNKL